MGEIKGCTPYTGIWDTPWLPELNRLVDFERWKINGLQRVSQILADDGSLKSFAQLQMEFNIPHSQFYQYLQLRHAYQAEDERCKSYSSSFSPIDLIQDRSTAKGLISLLYRIILGMYLTKFPTTYQSRWEGDIVSP